MALKWLANKFHGEIVLWNIPYVSKQSIWLGLKPRLKAHTGKYRQIPIFFWQQNFCWVGNKVKAKDTSFETVHLIALFFNFASKIVGNIMAIAVEQRTI